MTNQATSLPEFEALERQWADILCGQMSPQLSSDRLTKSSTTIKEFVFMHQCSGYAAMTSGASLQPWSFERRDLLPRSQKFSEFGGGWNAPDPGDARLSIVS